MEKAELKATIINNIIRLDNMQPLSMRQLSSNVGFSDSYMQKVLNGSTTPSLDALLKLANYYDVHISSLLHEDMQRTEKIRRVNDYLVTFDDNALNTVLTLLETFEPKANKRTN